MLWHNGVSVSLPLAGSVVVGRSTECEIVLNDSLVSRRHARLYVDSYGVILEDLGSANGVYVDGERLERQRLLRPGQRIVIGAQAFELCRTEDGVPRSGERPGTVTLDDRVTMAPAENDARPTDHASFLDAVADVVDHLLRHGDAASAERLVAAGLRSVLEAWREGHATDPTTAARSALLAARLASKTKRGAWVDYALEIYALQRRMMPAELVNALYILIRNVDKFDRRMLNRYVGEMTKARDSFGPSERFVLHRLQGLAQMAAT
jgi:hypothetical protein